MPRPVDAAMIQFDATSHDSPTTYSDHSNTEETPNAKGKPGLNSVHQITTLRQAISFARQTHDPYPMPRPVDAAMIQFDATSHDSPTTYSDHSNTEETPNAKGKPGKPGHPPKLVLSSGDSSEESLTAVIKRRLVSFEESFLSIRRLAKRIPNNVRMRLTAIEHY
ncbi:hypothetical protein ACOME3_005428 [Neoechinorhynchus agilis]